MLDSRRGPKGCGSGESLIGYVYGELGESARAAFEAHLSECGTCAEELASFTAIRMSVGEWKASEAVQQTPSAVRYAAPSEALFSRVFDLFRVSFGAKALAGAAAVVVVVLLGIFVFAFLNPRDTGNDVAGPAPTDDARETTERGTPVRIEETEGIAEAPAPLPADRASERAGSEIAGPRKKTVPVREPSPVRQQTVPPSQLADNNDLPRLSEAAGEEFEDDSLRLTDLFTGIGED